MRGDWFFVRAPEMNPRAHHPRRSDHPDEMPPHHLSRHRIGKETGSPDGAPRTRVLLASRSSQWGRRPAMATALEYVHALPLYANLGDRAYWPVPYRALLGNGDESLRAGFYDFLRYPRRTADQPFGFVERELRNRTAFLGKIQEVLESLEGFELNASIHALGANTSELALITIKPESWPSKKHPSGLPENEKAFYHHVVSRGLRPRYALDAVRGARCKFRSCGELLWHWRSRTWCDCQCDHPPPPPRKPNTSRPEGAHRGGGGVAQRGSMQQQQQRPQRPPPQPQHGRWRRSAAPS